MRIMTRSDGSVELEIDQSEWISFHNTVTGAWVFDLTPGSAKALREAFGRVMNPLENLLRNWLEDAEGGFADAGRGDGWTRDRSPGDYFRGRRDALRELLEYWETVRGR